MERMKNLQAHIDNSVLVTPGPSAHAVVLNRPSSLNTLTTGMITAIKGVLKQIKDDRKELMLLGAGSRAFCAGGDVVAIVSSPALAIEFFTTEYRLMYELSQTQSDRCALMRGYIMGGGVGLSLACNIRVATPSTVWAMPETIIGFIPDVGSSYYLARLSPPSIGLYLMLTGSRLTGPDCYFLGLATHYLPTDDLMESVAAEVAHGVAAADRYHRLLIMVGATQPQTRSRRLQRRA